MTIMGLTNRQKACEICDIKAIYRVAGSMSCYCEHHKPMHRAVVLEPGYWRMYYAHHRSEGVLAFVDDEPLTHILLHSPTGFEFGYAGSGPADLALSILANFFSEESNKNQPLRADYRHHKRAERLHQAFKFYAIAGNRFGDESAIKIAGIQIANWLDGLEEQAL